MNRTDRLYAIVEELRGRSPDWMSATALANRFELSARTIERDQAALQQAGVPIYATPGRRGGYALDTKHTLPPLNLTPGEVAAIATALSTDVTPPIRSRPPHARVRHRRPHGHALRLHRTPRAPVNAAAIGL